MVLKISTWILSCLLLICSISAIAANQAEDGFGDLNLAEQWSGDFDGMVKNKYYISYRLTLLDIAKAK